MHPCWIKVVISFKLWLWKCFFFLIAYFPLTLYRNDDFECFWWHSECYLFFINSSAVPVNDKWTAITAIPIWAFTGVDILSLAVHQGKITHCCSITLIILTFEIEFSTINPKTWIPHEVVQRSSTCWINFNLFFWSNLFPLWCCKPLTGSQIFLYINNVEMPLH